MKTFITFTNCKFKRDLNLVVQTVSHQARRLKALEKLKPDIKTTLKYPFLKQYMVRNGKIIISSMDGIIPYAAARFRFHGSGML